MHNLTIIGTSHIAKQSLKEVEDAIEKIKPDIVAVELDKKRLHALFEKKEDKINFYAIRKVGLKGFLFSLFGAWAEKKLGKLVGVSPGSEMKKAIEIARKHHLKIALIDQDIEITLKKFSKALTWKEKWTFVREFFAALFGRRTIDFDLRTVPGKTLIKKMLKEVEIKYPSIYRVLISERNEIMAYHLQNLAELNPDKKIIAIIGAGHEEGIRDLLAKNTIQYSFSIKQ